MKSANPQPSVAIVCDWITSRGGAERVIHQLHVAFPDAPIYTSTYEVDRGTLFKGADIRTAWFQKLPKALRKHQLLTIPRQWHFGHLKLRGYDAVISIGSSEAKAVRAPGGTHINICYTPTLQYWVKPENYLQKGSTGGINPLWRLGLRVLMPYVKRWDLKAAKRPDKMYAISTAVQQRITKYYSRDSDILFPSTDIHRFANDNSQTRSGFITWGRQVKHKQFDLAIRTCNQLQMQLLVVGDGPEHDYLKSIAGPTVTFKTDASDADITSLVAGAEAFIFPNEEDFGIVAIEAQAAGTPVVAYRGGGALDTVVEGVTGEFFDEQTIPSLRSALQDFDYTDYTHGDIVANAQKFSNQIFIDSIQKIVTDAKEQA